MYIDSNSLAGRKVLAECPFLPFALAEAARFCKKYPGRFDLDELQSIAAEALFTSEGFEHSRKAIAGALADFARDGLKVVRDIEMSEEDFARTRGGPPSNARLLAGPGKASSKHGKVRLALGRSSFKDGWSQKPNERVSAKINVDGDGDDSEAADPRGGNISIAGSPTVAEPEHVVINPNRPTVTPIRRHFVPPPPDISKFVFVPPNWSTPVAREVPFEPYGMKWGEHAGLPEYSVDANHQHVATIGEDYGCKREKSGFPDLVLESPKITPIVWHREAPRHQVG